MTGTNQNFDPEKWSGYVEKYRADVARVTPSPSGEDRRPAKSGGKK